MNTTSATTCLNCEGLNDNPDSLRAKRARSTFTSTSAKTASIAR
jgi:hypothetical protein